jgi:hypothetical protein
MPNHYTGAPSTNVNSKALILSANVHIYTSFSCHRQDTPSLLFQVLARSKNRQRTPGSGAET